MNIELQYTSEEAAKRYGQDGPSYGSKDAAAIDLRAAVNEVITLLPGEQVLVPTGIKLNMLFESGVNRMAAIALPRSGKGTKEGLVLANTAGLIDQDYQGEIMLACWARPTSGHLNFGTNRLGGNPVHIEPWERIAQLMFVPVLRVGFNVVSEFSGTTARADGGFGSTGND